MGCPSFCNSGITNNSIKLFTISLFPKLNLRRNTK